MKANSLAVIALATFIMSGCAGRFPLVGLDENARPITARVSKEKYVGHLAEALTSIQESVIPALDAQTTETTKWNLRTAVVGFGVKVEGGIGPFKVGIKPRLRAAFANGEKPPIP